MNYTTCPVYDCCGGTIIRDNGMRARCRTCDGRGVVEAPRVTASREPMAIHGARGTDIHEHAGPPIVTPAPGQHVIVLDDLTPDEARVITGLVRAMRESRGGLLGPNENFGGIGAAKDCLRVGALGSAAWHIAHALRDLGDEDASRVLGERGW